MSGTATAFDALWADCTAKHRLVPMPPQWSQLYKLLKNTRQKPSGGLPFLMAPRPLRS